ncbi:nucleoside phosphatase GDA1/CD39 [Basidiobolus meristosporus CBS 931.73]|uniref:guanosine-diphosphatase n=1 Tax=Basidiobolus meristosporus CBS 931.73 TaxID=1314790 RepID=A0A1Y1XXW8_9FUNG|nr:nucleoside phosphatase GDA1/CD39 [Basidiobolus meristosporus CBS 931.73]|eukprot:ORX90600.1 nucleoside phosphatase GDA1/CD39 [Basidiobolus meristosporus CBS 931.73]
MIDAGSTGSRVHVYKFNYCKENPELESEVFEQLKPGLSNYPNDPLGAAKSLDSLMVVAMENIPKELHSCTPVAVKATAGLRLLGAEPSARILEAVRHRLETVYPFSVVQDGGVEIMDGSNEGVYAWITVNYLLEKLGQPSKVPTAAVFDLGGGSTQIVFEPTFTNGTQLEYGEHQYQMDFGNHKYELYQHSYLGYGLMEARKLIKASIAESQSTESTINHPCVFPGSELDFDWTPHNSTSSQSIKLTGSAEGMQSCHEVVKEALNKSKTCNLKPCAFDGVYQPSLVDTFGNNDIYIFSYFYDLTQALGMNEEFKLEQLREATERVCRKDVDYFQTLSHSTIDINQALKDNAHYCMDMTFIYSLLHDGYELPDSRDVKVAKKIKDMETGWCLGASISLLDQGDYCKVQEV